MGASQSSKIKPMRGKEHWKAKYYITEKAFIAHIHEKGASLTSLDVSACYKLTDASVVAVAEHCPGLMSLIVYECRNLTDASVVAVAEHCPGLPSLTGFPQKNAK